MMINTGDRDWQQHCTHAAMHACSSGVCMIAWHRAGHNNIDLFNDCSI